ncbi:MAG: hypothetical protein CMJ84_01690 [Planctomycetes bacterium]|nr:hypothetical protein [Planctomycetota bacterium]MDP6410143.1 sulfatase-like hydrolase/transferase [Planctomycetota bacterium]
MSRQTLVWAALAGAAAIGGACTDGGPARDAPNLLIITLDTTRGDRLGCYGYEPAVTPRIDELAASGTCFLNAFAPTPFTLPSHSTLMTGNHPPGHGVHVNYSGRVAVSDEVPTLADVLSARGYRTGAFIAARVLNDHCGLARGFDHYSDIGPLAGDDPEAPVRLARSGDLVCDDALAWLNGGTDGPFFAWVHFFDAHDPYTPREGFEDIGDHPYDGEIAFVDTQVARLIDWLDESGLRESTLVVLGGDHGEGLGEHGEATHGLFVYDTTLRVPLVLSRPGAVSAGHRPRATVGLVDVMPTVLAQLDIAAPAELEGRDLSPLLAGQDDGGGAAYFESEYGMRTMGWAPLRGWIEFPWKYTEAPTRELFHLENDPGETVNLIDERPGIAERLRAALEEFRETTPRRQVTETSDGTDEARELAMLGYLESDFELPEGAALEDLRDPRDAYDVYYQTKYAADLLKEGRHGEALELIEPLIARSPESARIWTVLGSARLKLGKFAGAAEAFEESLARNPDLPPCILGLGDALRGQGLVEEAIAAYERCVRLDPNHGQAHSRLGLLRAGRGETDAAIASLRRFAKLEPDSPNAHCNLAGVLAQSGRAESALAELRTALRLDPACKQAHVGLALILESGGRREEALRARRAAHEALPDDPDLAAALAWLLATRTHTEAQSPAEAVVLARTARESAPANPRFADIHAAALAAAGDFAAAVVTAEEALALARGQLSAAVVAQVEARLRAYRNGQAYRE